MNVATCAYPGLELHVVTADWPAALGALPAPAWLAELLRADAAAPCRSDDEVRRAVRDLLRHHGYRPTGRGKPSAEYLAAAAADARLGAINPAVDAGNVVSLHSGLPISIVDRDRVRPPLSVDVPPAGSRYVFNRSGQTIDVGGLVSLCDADGPCANAVKDAQRTKTDADTRNVIALVWGVQLPAGRAAAAARWLAGLFERLDARVTARVAS